LVSQAGQYAVFYDAHGACFGCGVILEALPGGQDFHAAHRDDAGAAADAEEGTDAHAGAGGAAVALLAAAAAR
jgi:hypothetical protein